MHTPYFFISAGQSSQEKVQRDSLHYSAVGCNFSTAAMQLNAILGNCAIIAIKSHEIPGKSFKGCRPCRRPRTKKRWTWCCRRSSRNSRHPRIQRVCSFLEFQGSLVMTCILKIAQQISTEDCSTCVSLALVCRVAIRAHQRVRRLRQRIQQERDQAIIEEVWREIATKTNRLQSKPCVTKLPGKTFNPRGRR